MGDEIQRTVDGPEGLALLVEAALEGSRVGFGGLGELRGVQVVFAVGHGRGFGRQKSGFFAGW